MEGRLRKRKASLRSDGVLQTTEDVLLFVLSYLKNHPTQEYHAAVWGMYQGQAHPYLKQGLEALRQTLLKQDMLPARTAFELAERLATFDVLEASVHKKMRLDGTERPVERPQNPEQQRKLYSGKKKAHHQTSDAQ
jgi:hypothetical protein